MFVARSLNRIGRFAILGAAVCCAPTSAADPPRPNIVLVMADDLGWADLGCYGSEIETPNIDALARAGLRFTQFYNTAKCHSSRVSLLSGLYCHQAGNSSLSRAVTIAEVLDAAGYFAAMTGKWHLDGQPTDRGFSRYFGHLSGATNFFTGDNTFRLNGQAWNGFDEDFYATDADVDFAIRFLDEAARSDKPFFLYVAFNAPHYPLQAPEEDVMKYRGKYRIGWDEVRAARYERQLEMGLVEPRWKPSPRPGHVPDWESLSDEGKDWEDFRMATFAAMVDRVDRNMGRLIGYLKERGVLDETLIMFCSDNGACPFERTRGRQFMPWDARSYWTYDTGWAHVGNTPFRLYKQNQHEGGIASPLIVHWPDGLKTGPGTVTDQPGHLIDFMATCVDLGRATYPKRFDGRPIEPLQGRSLAPIFQGRRRQGHPWIYQQFSTNRAIRQGKWKLVTFRAGPWELYDLDADRTELNDLAAEHPEKLEQMKRLWHQVAEQVDHLPANNRRPVSDRPGKPNFLSRGNAAAGKK